jgi:hypothetical protein
MEPGWLTEFDKTLFNEFKSDTFNDIEQKLFYPNKDSIDFFINENNRLKSICKSQTTEISGLCDNIQKQKSEISKIRLINERLELENDKLSFKLNKINNEPRNFKVYIHLKTGIWIYIGQTGQELEERWQNGEGYKQHNQMLYYQIKKYGWKNIHHLLYKDNLTKKEADTIEQDLIHFYAKNEIATGLMVLNLAHNVL